MGRGKRGTGVERVRTLVLQDGEKAMTKESGEMRDIMNYGRYNVQFLSDNNI